MVLLAYLWGGVDDTNLADRNQRFSEVFRDISEVFRGPLRDPLRGRFPFQRLSVLLPLIVLPLELSPRGGGGCERRSASDSEVAETSAETAAGILGQTGQTIVDKLTTLSNKIQEQSSQWL